MAQIVRHQVKFEIPRAFRHALRASDIERCCTGLYAGTLHLDLHFTNKQEWSQEDRLRLRAAQRCHVLEVSFRLRTGSSWWLAPWDGVENPVVLSVDVYPLPKEIIEACGRQQVGETLQEEVHRVFQVQTNWSFRIDLDLSHPQLLLDDGRRIQLPRAERRRV